MVDNRPSPTHSYVSLRDKAVSEKEGLFAIFTQAYSVVACVINMLL